MEILEHILNAQGGSSVREMASRLGIGETDAKRGMESLMPALTGALQRNMRQGDGADKLFNALRNGKHAAYLEEPQRMQREETVQDGNKILGHLFGSKDVSRQVASEASNESGLSSGVLKKMLPMLATMAMGSMSKKTRGMPGSGGGGNQLGSLLGSFLGGGQQQKQSGLGGLIGKLFG